MLDVYIHVIFNHKQSEEKQPKCPATAQAWGRELLFPKCTRGQPGCLQGQVRMSWKVSWLGSQDTWVYFYFHPSRLAPPG